MSLPPLVEWAKTAHLPPLPTPAFVHKMHHDPVYDNLYYTADQMRDYGELCRKQALEQAAQVCAVVCSERWDKWGDGYNQGALDCETRIKELK